MTDFRSIQRLRLTVIIALTGALALGSFWMVEMMRRTGDEVIPERPAGEPDYYVEKFNFVRTSNTGEVQYHIAGDRLVHNPANDSFEVQHPVVNSLFRDGPRMTVQAERGVVDNNRTKVHLYDNVVAERPAAAATPYFRLQSEYLLILPEEDVMQTDKPVEIRFDQSTLTGTGMVANNASRRIQILANVHAVYQSPATDVSR